jgi:hypothetical protein
MNVRTRCAACCLVFAAAANVATAGPAVDITTIVDSVSAAVGRVDTFQADADIYSST